MAEPVLMYLTYLGVILIIGLFCSILSNKLKIPSILLLLFAGIGLKFIKYEGETVFAFPNTFIAVLGILALILIVFDSTSRFKFKEIDKFSVDALKLTGYFVMLVIIILGLVSKFVLETNFYLAFVFAAFMAGTAPDVILSLVGSKKHKILEILQIESIINTPLIVLLPFIILDFMQSIGGVSVLFDTFLQQIVPFLQQIVVGVGAGVVIGLVIFKVLSNTYSETFSPIAIVSSALLTYVIAENMGGNGVLAVTTMALIFGNFAVRGKSALQNFTSVFSRFFEIIVFVLIGLMINFPFDKGFFIKSLSLFALYLVVRYFAVHLTFKKDMPVKEKVFMTLNAPKGIATAVVIILLTTVGIVGLDNILDIGLAFVVYSIVLASIAVIFSRYFIHMEIVQPEMQSIKPIHHHTETMGESYKAVNKKSKKRK